MRWVTILTAAVLAMSVFAGCGGDDSKVDAYCTKANDCNALTGTSKTECIENVNKCTDALTASQLSDWGKAADVCNGFATCSAFITCANQLPGCR